MCNHGTALRSPLLPVIGQCITRSLHHNERVRARRQFVPAAGRSYRPSTVYPMTTLSSPAALLTVGPYAVPISMRPNSTIYNEVYHVALLRSAHRKPTRNIRGQEGTEQLPSSLDPGGDLD